MRTADAIDAALELLVAPSFTRVGYAARSRLFDWTPVADLDLTGRHIAITGATSGLGYAAARRFASCGAVVIIVGRDEGKLASTGRSITDAADGADVRIVVADLAEIEQVSAAASTIARDHDRLDALVHNAGALLIDRAENSAGVEVTVAAQVDGPFALTALLAPLLRGGPAPGRVVTMSSGGMYTAPLAVAGLEMTPADYDGTQQYALAKRAQVTLNEMWSARADRTEIVFHAVHPGWADTPGVRVSLPTFSRVVGPLLRTPAEGADTMEWLVAGDAPLGTSGGFWLDRRVRPIHRLRRTRRSDTPERRERLWNRCVESTGIDPDDALARPA